MKHARRLIARKSPIHGNGVFATADLPAGETLIEYTGKRITHAQADRKYAGGSETGHTFLFTLNERYIVDANVDGNDARWINHSCDPNCQAVIEEAEGKDRREDRVLIESVREIRSGEELTYDYGIVLDEPHTKRIKKVWACQCGAKNCTGTMLKPKPRRKRDD